MPDDAVYVLSPAEIVHGLPLGHTGALPRSEYPDDTSPRTALERVLRDALQRSPCAVAFSGGRDSSVLLAVATHVARRDGLPEPIPVTRVFPGVDRADEKDWQEAVVRHLRLGDWRRIVLGDEADLVGPTATSHLVEYGVVWPPTIHNDAPLVELVPGGSLVDGEGGDEVFGVAEHRIAPVARLARALAPLRRRRVRAALDALAPAPLRERSFRRRWAAVPLTWLRPPARAALVDAMWAVERTQPLSFAASVRMVPRRRTQVLGLANRRHFAARHDVELASPLQHPEVVHALARVGGSLGQGERTDVLRALAAGLLPDSVLSRTTKAEFGAAYMAGPTRRFVETWDGTGLDPNLVDVDELRRIWLGDVTIAPTGALLQAAWLATNHARTSCDGTDALQ